MLNCDLAPPASPHPNPTPAAEMEDDVSDAMLKEVCITEQTQYYFESSQLTFRGNIDCGNCTR